MTVESEKADFRSFVVTAERDCRGDDADEDCGDPASPDRSGSLQLMDDGVTFHPECVNTVVPSEPGTEMKRLRLMWVAPKTGSGCVYIRCSSVESSLDSGGVARKIEERS